MNVDSYLGLENFNLNKQKTAVALSLNKIKSLPNVYKIWVWKNQGVEINYSCTISNSAKANFGIDRRRKGTIYIGSKAQISEGVILDCWGGKIALDENVFLGPYTVVYGHGNVEIGKDSLIAMHCRIISSNHAIPNRNISIRSQPNIPLPVIIGKDVWLGAGVTVLGGVIVGDGCVVGAGAVVTKDLPPYSVAVGIPAQVIKQRSEIGGK